MLVFAHVHVYNPVFQSVNCQVCHRLHDISDRGIHQESASFIVCCCCLDFLVVWLVGVLDLLVGWLLGLFWFWMGGDGSFSFVCFGFDSPKHFINGNLVDA